MRVRALRLFSSILLLSATGCYALMTDVDMSGGEFGATQGGIQDMGYARELIASGIVPPPEAFVVEGMFSEHDLPLEGEPCTTLLCLRGAPGIAPDADDEPAGWVQIGMSSTIDPESFERPSLTLVATVDVSGSMGWEYSSLDDEYVTPGELSQQLLSAIADELGPEDRIAIVTYGSSVKTPLAFTEGDSEKVDREIEDLHEGGSTNMEAGLKRAFELARDADFGTDEVRVMLFTDVQPNVGATSSSEFEQMASDAANDGIGLTVFATGVGLGQEVLLGMSHLRGGNAFSLFEEEDVVALMEDSWPWMVSPIAYDLAVSILRPSGYTIASAYGFPSATGSSSDSESEAAELEVATVFLSRRKGALLLELQPDGTVPLESLQVVGSLSYETPSGDPMSQDLLVSTNAAVLDERGHWYEQHSVGRTVSLALLVEGMQDAAERYGSAQNEAVAILESVVARFEADAASLGDEDLEPEVALGQALLELMQDGASQESPYGYY